MWQWQITEFEGGQPLLDALALRIPAAPRAYLHQLIRKGRVRSDGQPLDDGTIVVTGMRLTLPASARLLALAEQCGIPPQAIRFEDRHALVVEKPAGLAIHQAVGHDDNLTERVTRFLAVRHAPYRAAPVHRLDIGTSGPVLFGKGRWATGQYGRLLMDGRIGKGYLALVSGDVPAQGELTTPVPEGGVLKPALAIFRRIARAGSFCLLELDLRTGRQHQARRQLADAGWPIIGDRRYGGAAWNGLDHPFLHCHRLQFPSLDKDDLCRVDASLPESLMQILDAIGLPNFRTGDGAPR
jgi:23S rRNA-/tRNA-specific pseudouridylate synthase